MSHTQPRALDWRTFVQQYREWAETLTSAGVRARDPEAEIILIEGDAVLDHALADAVDALGHHTVVISGNARQAEGWSHHGALYILGDWLGDVFCYQTDMNLRVLGTVRANLAKFSAEDDEMTHSAPALNLDTPLLLTWFVQPGAPLRLPPQTPVLMFGEYEACERLTIANPLLIWHEGIYLLRDEMYDVVEEEWHDGQPWHTDAIKAALAGGESLWREGVKPEVVAPWRWAQAYEAANLLEAAFHAYRCAAELAPGFAPAHAGMGGVLWLTGAWEQALPHLRRARELFPTQQTGILDPAVLPLASALLYLGRAAEAEEVARAELARLSSTEAGAPMHRVLAEIALGQGRPGDVETALRHYEEGSYNWQNLWWLQGALAQRQGDAGRAAELLRKTRRYDPHATDPAEGATDLRWRLAPQTTVAWPTATPPADLFAPATPTLAYLLAHKPALLARLPESVRTVELLRELAQHAAASAEVWLAWFDPAQIDADMAATLVRQTPSLLAQLPRALITTELVRQVPAGSQYFPADAVPSELWDEALALHAMTAGANVSDLPHSAITEAVAMAAVRRNPYQITSVPRAVWNDALWIEAVAYAGESSFFTNDLPYLFATDENFIKQVIARRFEALQAIPGSRFNAELYAHAQTLYGQHPDWPALVEQHGLARGLDEGVDFAEQCWRAFWTEEAILEKLVQPERGLSPYEIPAEAYTQRIADACIDCHGLTWLADIPSHFVSDEHYEAFVEQSPDDLVSVPHARRSVAVCARALAQQHEQAHLVPAAMLAEVCDVLLTEADESDAWIWRLLRARARLMSDSPDLASAEADLSAILAAAEQDPERVDAQVLAHARYWRGYCHHLNGETGAAVACRQASGVAPGSDYAQIDPAASQARGDFPKEAFGALMSECERHAEAGDTVGCWDAAASARTLLADSGQTSSYVWAHVLDKQRWAALALGRRDDNLNVCREMVQRLDGLDFMAFGMHDQAQAAMLAAAHHRLGAAIWDEPELWPDAQAPNLEQLLASRAAHRRALALIGDAEEAGSMLEGFWDSHLRTLHALAGHDPAYTAQFQQALQQVLDMAHEDWLWSEAGRGLLSAA